MRDGPVVTPPFEVIRRKPGERAQGLLAGDLLVVHSRGQLGGAIRFGQRLHYRGADRTYAYWNHVVVSLGNDRIQEAIGRGLEQNSLGKYDDVDYTAIHFTEATVEQRLLAGSYAKLVHLEKYSFLTIAGLSVDLLTGGSIAIGHSSTQVCSGYGANSSRYMGVVYAQDTDTVMPATIAKWFGVTADA